MNNESYAEENIYFLPHFMTVASRTSNQVTQQNSGDVTSVNNSSVQERDMVKIIDERVEKKFEENYSVDGHCWIGDECCSHPCS